jgi:hypothetical protein
MPSVVDRAMVAYDAAVLPVAGRLGGPLTMFTHQHAVALVGAVRAGLLAALTVTEGLEPEVDPQAPVGESLDMLGEQRKVQIADPARDVDQDADAARIADLLGGGSGKPSGLEPEPIES